MTVPSPSHHPTPDFRSLFESAPGHYLVLTPDFTIVAVSDAYLRATMTRREEILGRGLFEVFPDNPNDPAATGTQNLRASLERVLAGRIPDAMAVQKYDIRRPESDGGGFEERHWSPVNSPVLAADGTLAYIIHRVEDVTEFVRLKEQGTEHHRLAEELRTRAGRMEAEVYRRAQEIQEANRELRALHAELERRVESRTAELKRANDDLQREIVERERAEEALRRSERQLLQAQKLEAVGRLAAGVAHDFNNMLTAILGYASLARMRIPEGGRIDSDLDEICKAGERAAGLTRQLLAFSRQQVSAPQLLDLNAAISDLDKMLRPLIGEDIDLVTHTHPNLGCVMADPGQIEQVLLNLVVNARDAMPHGGRLTIETGDRVLDESFAHGITDLQPGHYVMLAVSDDGIGMDAATLTRIFEPFFTTKDKSKGTGLGLSTVYGIVKQSGGSVEVYSEPGHGTTFKVYLPRVDATAGQAISPIRDESSNRGTETILLVEDEETVRGVARQALELHGYTVLEAGNGAEAIRLLERERTAVELMLTDVVMPGMPLPELLARSAALRPEMRVLCVSGYAEQAILHQALVVARTPFLHKPFTPTALVRKVRDVLDEGLRRAA